MECIDAIMTRKSVRAFTEDPLPDGALETLLRAAMAAPSAGNAQDWRFVVVTDRETLDALAAATPYAGPLRKAPVGIVICAEITAEKFEGRWPQDCSAAMSNLLLAAHVSGLGAVWLGVHPEAEREEAVARLIGTPEGVRPHSMVAVGVPERVPAPVDRYNEEFVHHERW